jgi:hypothetical protein
MRFLSGYALKKVFLIPCMKYRSKKDIPIPVEDPWNIPVAGEKLKLVGFLKTGDVCRSFGKGKMKMPLPVDTSGWGGISFQDSRLYVCLVTRAGRLSAGYVAGVACGGTIRLVSTGRLHVPTIDHGYRHFGVEILCMGSNRNSREEQP